MPVSGMFFTKLHFYEIRQWALLHYLFYPYQWFILVLKLRPLIWCICDSQINNQYFKHTSACCFTNLKFNHNSCFFLRLFLTCEITPKLPVNLLRAGRIITFEPPPGVRANLLRTFATIPPARMMRAPNERARLYFILAWFHAVIQVCQFFKETV